MSSPYRSSNIDEIAGRVAPGRSPFPEQDRGTETPPYQEERTLDVDANPATASIDVQLSKACRSVIVCNYTTCYVYLPDVNVWVPPFVFNAVIRLAEGVTKARALFQPPPFQAQPAGVVGNRCVLRFTEELLPPNPGVRYTP